MKLKNLFGVGLATLTVSFLSVGLLAQHDHHDMGGEQSQGERSAAVAGSADASSANGNAATADTARLNAAQATADINATSQAMSHHHEGHSHMGAHMHMSVLRDPQPGDAEKAQRVADQAREALEKYRDYHVALADGFKIFLPNVPQPMYHFTSNAYAIEAAFFFDPTKPTSLLYEKHGDDYKLIGAMYTAPVRFTEDQLNQRIPLSMAQWHQHVNMCRPPKGREVEMLAKKPQFGLAGSISTPEECEAAGGTFMPHVFGWMVHVYPWEKTSDAVWSVERQINEQHHHGEMN